MRSRDIAYILELTEREAQVLMALTIDVLNWKEVPEAEQIHMALLEAGVRDIFSAVPHSTDTGYRDLVRVGV